MVSPRHSRSSVLVASLLLAGGLAAAKARADIYVHVMNCVDSTTVKAAAYDAKDAVRTTPASEKEISTGNNEQLHCAGEGEGYCQMQFKFEGTPDRCYGDATDWGGKHIDSGKWAVVKGLTLDDSYGPNGRCTPTVEQYDSQPKNCYDVCGNCLD
jgi:hypothetical protein